MKHLATIMFLLTLSIAAHGAEVALEWDSNTEPDLSHYNVYRSDDFNGPFAQVNATTKTIATSWTAARTTQTTKSIVFTANNGTLLAESAFEDKTVVRGAVYWYVVTAVDTSGNESGYSNPVGKLAMAKVGPVNPTGLR